MEMHSDTARDWPVLAVPVPQTAEELRGKARHFDRHGDSSRMQTKSKRTGQILPPDYLDASWAVRSGSSGMTVSQEFVPAKSASYLEQFVVHEDAALAMAKKAVAESIARFMISPSSSTTNSTKNATRGLRGGQ